LAEDVAVIIVNWNAGDLLERCLAAVAQQTRRPRRVIVVDNASTDGSAAGLESRHPGLEVVRNAGNAGFAAANNRAVQMAADCAWIALLNPDAFPEPTWLERLCEAGARETRYTFFASRLVLANDPDRLDGIGDSYSVSGLGWRRGHGQPTATTGREACEVFGPCAAAALYRRDAFVEAGSFDESFFCYFEDMDLAFRLRLLGHRCLYVPDAVVRHVGSALTGRRSDFSVYHGHRNLVWTFVKDMPTPLFFLYLPLHVGLNLFSLVWLGLRGQAGVVLRAKRDALRGLPRAWRARRSVQARRKAGIVDLWRVMEGGLRRPGRGVVS
jgi:GT2 family glycosyltransferase